METKSRAQEGATTATVMLPAQWNIEGKIAGSLVRQLRLPAREAQARLVRSGTTRSPKSTLFLASGSSVDLKIRRSLLPAGSPETIYTIDIEAFLSGCADPVEARWLSPAASRPDRMSPTDAQNARDSALASWERRFEFKEERRSGDQVVATGLRPPQVGALYGILAHWKVSKAPATVVMPTGTGKTETMLALLTRESLGRLLVIVPTNHLREQIGEKFVTLGLLKTLGVLGADAAYPVVALLERKPKTPNEVDAVFARCNVVVTTMSIAGQCTEAVQRRMAELCTHLFIDEAHHVSARTWEALRKRFTDRPIIQFTATPFRNDGKLVDGKVVFNYPLRKAQAEGYFKQIRFKPVDEFDLQEADQTIAEAAIEQLDADRREGRPHLVMARCADIKRAKQVHAIYEKIAPSTQPQLLHNEVTAPERRDGLAALRAGRSTIVVCVDMSARASTCLN